MKAKITVVYSVGVEIDLPRNFKKLSYEEIEKIKEEIYEEADKNLIDFSQPIIHDAVNSSEETIEELID